MVRIILSVIAGFVIWSVLWVGSDFILMMISPGWYAKQINDLDAAAKTGTAFMPDSVFFVIALVRSVFVSLISGYLTALSAKENSKSTLGLGVLLLAFGIFVQSVYWNNAPLWYHLSFLILLIPMTILGGKLKKS